jgi:hypothetical protein
VTVRRIGLAIAFGLALSSLPFLRYLHLGNDSLPHADHAARHGGQLHMVGDRHLELVRRRGQIEVFTSDAVRRPVAVTSGEVSFDGGDPRPLTRNEHRLVAPDEPQAGAVEIVVILEDGTRLATRFDFSGAPVP